ncbi:uncharacterized protein LOC129591132 [Paramacrobiotus metropolitanus]|uniref:uncharacterized protein LOC129591132 n=1 Tax=Paramacrobiotus metropolitanus TaxID=2943436 RepID=UPI002445CA4B|nr:uncharacterized protein LOC129591132 [Paramacrobiotus metropolitanus]
MTDPLCENTYRGKCGGDFLFGQWCILVVTAWNIGITMTNGAMLILFTMGLFPAALAYYQRYKSYGTGDTIIATGYLGGGSVDEYQRWLIECNDGEGMTGIFAAALMPFYGISQVWCNFLFPRKPPSAGIYPYYPSCNVRNMSVHELYCYDKVWPRDTADTFVTGLYSSVNYDPVSPTLFKCCKTPTGYKLDYNRCQWKYTHDKMGEHYDGYWITKCDTNNVMTGIGWAKSPWDDQFHYTWIQCCPVVYLPGVQVLSASQLF